MSTDVMRSNPDAGAQAASTATFSQPLSRCSSYVVDFLAGLVAQARKIQVRQNKKRLRVCETVALGDKRFVAVIQVDDQQFLLGGSSTSVSLLAQLEKPTEFAKVLSARVAEVNG
jgi:flagellar biogenesis protein FliO